MRDLSEGRHPALQERVARFARRIGYHVTEPTYHEMFVSRVQVALARNNARAAEDYRHAPDLLLIPRDPESPAIVQVEIKTRSYWRHPECANLTTGGILLALRNWEGRVGDEVGEVIPTLFVYWYASDDAERGFYPTECFPPPTHFWDQDNGDLYWDEARRRWPGIERVRRRATGDKASDDCFVQVDRGDLDLISFDWKDELSRLLSGGPPSWLQYPESIDDIRPPEPLIGSPVRIVGGDRPERIGLSGEVDEVWDRRFVFVKAEDGKRYRCLADNLEVLG